MTSLNRPSYLPGDPPPHVEVERIIRVDHAGEYGAVRIYDGQLAVTGRGRGRDEIRRMAEQEKRHLAEFEDLARARRVRPTVLQPLWHLTGFALGAATALLGARAAMACTVGVEEVIDEHYRDQAERLGNAEPVLRARILDFRADELRHRDAGLAYGAADSLGFEIVSAVARNGSRLAIWLSTRF